MTRFTLIVLILCSAGCYGDSTDYYRALNDPVWVKTCDVPYYDALYAAFDIDCGYASKVIENARIFHDAAGTLDAEDYARLARNKNIRVLDVDRFQVLGTTVIGVNSPFGLALTRDMAMIVHEELHAIDSAGVFTITHPNWDDGRWALGDIFTRCIRGNTTAYGAHIRGHLPQTYRDRLVAAGYEPYFKNAIFSSP